jgi:hypothetical protein
LIESQLNFRRWELYGPGNQNQKSTIENSHRRSRTWLNSSSRQAGDVVVLDMTGRITIGEGSIALRRRSLS